MLPSCRQGMEEDAPGETRWGRGSYDYPPREEAKHHPHLGDAVPRPDDISLCHRRRQSVTCLPGLVSPARGSEAEPRLLNLGLGAAERDPSAGWHAEPCRAVPCCAVPCKTQSPRHAPAALARTKANVG